MCDAVRDGFECTRVLNVRVLRGMTGRIWRSGTGTTMSDETKATILLTVALIVLWVGVFLAAQTELG